MEYEHGAENQPMDGNPSMRGPSESATHIARADCPHLSDPEWEALQRLATVIGETAVATMLRTLSPKEQHGVALGFIVKEQRDAAAATTTTASSGTTPRVQSLKLRVSNNVGKEGEPLLRWIVEVDTAIISSTNRRRLRSPCHILADERGAGRMDAGSRTLRASAHMRSSRRSSDKCLSLQRTSSGRGLSSSTCSKVSMTFMLTPNVHGTWSRTS
ncbi:hypothetical protein PC116_g2738 [Phytophthora cactorum]|nr:hypothetical protein Pcac1_g23350 [Phytophthora cactorum]KAG4249545.1 hypothetical protein PC116_g2738 [Phytophthora cactorum]